MYRWKGNLTESRFHFKYWKNILISLSYEQISRNDPAMAPEQLFKKNLELLKYELIMYQFKARGLEISNIYQNLYGLKNYNLLEATHFRIRAF